MDFFSSGNIIALFQNSSTTIASKVAELLTLTTSSLAEPLIGIYIMFTGFLVVGGKIDKVKDKWVRLFILVPIFSKLFMDYNSYMSTVVFPILEFQNAITSLIVTQIGGIANDGTIYSVLDKVLFSAWGNMSDVFLQGEEFSIFKINEYFNTFFVLILPSIAIFLITLFMFINMLRIIIESMLFLKILLMIGVIPIFAFVIPENGAKTIFWNWFKNVLIYFLYIPIVFLFMLIAINILDTVSDTWGQFILSIVALSILNGIIIKVPTFVSGLVTGFGGAGESSSFNPASMSKGVTNKLKGK